jgi:hypothetical protein
MNSQQHNSCKIVFPRDILCFKYISVNKLHEGDDNDDDDDDNNDDNIPIPFRNTVNLKQTAKNSI